MKLCSGTLTRLQPGFVVLHDNAEYLVTYVNDCRAVIKPRSRSVATITTHDGKTVSFDKPGAPLNISPNSDLPIIGLDREWIATQKQKQAAKQKLSTSQNL